MMHFKTWFQTCIQNKAGRVDLVESRPKLLLSKRTDKQPKDMGLLAFLKLEFLTKEEVKLYRRYWKLSN